MGHHVQHFELPSILNCRVFWRRYIFINLIAVGYIQSSLITHKF
jgi:hypothetical protein